MKKVIALLFCIVGFAQAQNRQVDLGKPVSVSNAPDNTSTRNEKLGDISTTSIVKDNFIFRGNSAEPGENIGAIYPAGGGRATYVKSMVLTASKLCVMRVNYGTFSNLFAINASTSNPVEVVVGPNAPVVIPINQTIRNLHAMPQAFVRTVFECSHQQYVAQVSPSTLGAVKSAYSTALNNPSNSYTYTLAVNNSTGSATSGTITVVDSLPDGVKVTGATGTGWTIAISSRGRSLTATSSTAIANGASSNAMTITLTPQVAGTYTATYITDDVPNDRPRSQDAVFIGTSITDNYLATNYTTGFAQQVCTYLRDTKGIDVDLVPFGKGGSTSSEHEFLRKNEGRYNFDRQPWGIFYEAASVNDILQSVPTATSVANVVAMINHKKKFYPNSYLFILSPTPNANSGTESSLVTLRSAIQSAVSTNGDGNVKIFFISGTGSAWSPANLSGKTAADGIHLTDSGYADIATAIITALGAILP